MLRQSFVFDMDGVIADIRHRHHYVERGKATQDWDTFFSSDELENDLLIVATRNLMRGLLAGGATLVILTARPEKTRVDTTTWLAHHDVPWNRLIMRPDADHNTQSAAAWKVNELDTLQGHCDLISFFDDSRANVLTARAIGVPSILYAIGTID